MRELWLIRHGETDWSRSGAHTGRTDIPLTPRGVEQARELGRVLGGADFSLILTSPLQRARESCRLAGFGDSALVDKNLSEWDYGAYEGRTTDEIRREAPGWSLWEAGVPGGETVEQVAARAQHIIERASEVQGRVALFGHGHLLRILTACWLGLPANAGRLFALNTASVSRLGFERETRVILSWNLVAGELAV